MGPQQRSPPAGPEPEDGQVGARTDRIGEPGHPVAGELARVGQDPLRQELAAPLTGGIRVDEPRDLLGGVRPDRGVVVHVQHPHVLARLALSLPQLVQPAVRPGLRLSAVGRRVVARHVEDSHVLRLQRLELVTGLGRLLCHDVDPPSGEVRRDRRFHALDHPAQRGHDVDPADGRNLDDQQLITVGVDVQPNRPGQGPPSLDCSDDCHDGQEGGQGPHHAQVGAQAELLQGPGARVQAGAHGQHDQGEHPQHRGSRGTQRA